MTKATLWMTGALVMVMGTAGIAYAKGGPDGGQRGKGGNGMEMMFQQLDTDGDGKVTQAEIDALKAARFAEADTDGDGFLSPEEMTAQAEKMHAERQARMRAARSDAMFKNLDTDNDGKVSAEEAAAQGPAKMLDRLDADDDGAVTLEEMQQARGKMGRHAGRGDGEGRGKHGRGGDHERGGKHGRGGERGEGNAPWWLR